MYLVSFRLFFSEKSGAPWAPRPRRIGRGLSLAAAHIQPWILAKAFILFASTVPHETIRGTLQCFMWNS